MPTFDYNRSKDTADRLIVRFGQSAILSRTPVSGPSYDPVFGTPQLFNIKIAVLNYSNYEFGSGRIRVTDKKVLMSAKGLTIEPELTDKIIIGSVSHTIVGPDEGNGIRPLNPGGVAILYELQCRA